MDKKMITFNMVKIIVPSVLVLVLGYALVKRTVETSVESKYKNEYEQYKRELIESEEKKYAEQINKMKTEYEQKISRITQTEKVIVIEKDGKTVITEKTKIDENNQTKSKDTSKSKTVAKDDKSTIVDNTEKKSGTEIEITDTYKKVSLDSTFRVYGIVMTGDNLKMKEEYLKYGSGVMYDINILNVGFQGIYSPVDSEKFIGLTFGVSF